MPLSARVPEHPESDRPVGAALEKLSDQCLPSPCLRIELTVPVGNTYTMTRFNPFHDVLDPSAQEACTNLEDSTFDEFEKGMLTVARHFLSTRDTPALQAWRYAYDIAVEQWGESLGFPASYRMQKVVAAVLSVREGDFVYLDPMTPESRYLITKDETHLLAMLHNMRRENTPAARDAVEELCGGFCDPHLVRAGLALAHRFSVGAKAAKPYSKLAQLRIVS